MQDGKRSESFKKILHLPIIAPKDDQSSSADSSRSGRPLTGPAVTPRTRLPPRSRTGCWTCRTRKVKCDEGRPVCGQCTRLGHNCDYNPRLSFRDDTPRVVERMQEVSTIGSSIWDCLSVAGANRSGKADFGTAASPVPTEGSAGSAAVDDLPPFAQLSTDEDRERKAERSSPGTYHVVVNPDSFQHLPEYNDDPEIKREILSPLRRGSLAISLASSFGRESVLESGPGMEDPNIVILPRFEDVHRRGPGKDGKSPASSGLIRIKTEDFEEVTTWSEERHSVDGRYLKHFKTVVWKQLVPAEIEHLDGMEGSSVVILENEAAFFPPLYHAMMAVAALSLAGQDGKERLDALGHYQQALPALQSTLKSAEDLSSDGALLTHFLLLVYEIAAAEASHSNMWSHHVSTLLRISLQRRDVFGGERYPFIIWWICLIDLDALFSGAGSGDFVGTMLKNDIIPPPSFQLHPLGIDGSSVVYANELDTLPTILQLDFEITILAATLALLAHEYRQDTTFGRSGPLQTDRDTRMRQSRIYELQEQLRQTWLTPAVLMIGQNVEILPVRSKRLFEHAATLYRACILYSHTSMWPSQRLDTSPDYDTEIAVASNQLLQMTSKILQDRRVDCRFLMFPVFMAGFASTDGPQKSMALHLIGLMEKDSIGRNTVATRKALELVYEKQNERFMMTGHSLDVDWLDVMREQHVLIVNFGL